MGEKGELKIVTSIFILRNSLTQGTMCPDKEHCESHCVGEDQDLSLNVLILRCQLDIKKEMSRRSLGTLTGTANIN